MPLNSIQPGAQLRQVKVSDNKPVATEKKNQFAERFKAASNCINTISLRHGSSAKIANNSDVVPVTKYLTRLLSEKAKKCNNEIYQKVKELNEIQNSIKGNISFANSLKSVTTKNVRLKGEEFKPCDSGLRHCIKSMLPTKYNESLQSTRKQFKTLDKKRISVLLENEICKGKDKIDRLDKEIATRKNVLENIKADLNNVKSNTSILTEMAGKMSKKEVNDLAETTGAGNSKGRVLNDKEKSAFFSIYSTNCGCREINSALSANRELAIDKKEVIKEIQRRWGDDIFARGAVKEKEAINSIGKINLEDLKQVLKNMYDKAIRSNSASKTKTLYRGQNVDEDIINKIGMAYEEKKLFNPGYLMSTSESRDEASKFTGGNAIKLLIKVEGVSGISVYSPHIVVKEQEYVFTPQSKFEIREFKPQLKDKYCEVTLVEKKPDEYEDKESVTFPRY